MTAFQSWQGRRVFVTGHTGFKGGWLVKMLADLGADVFGYSLAPLEPSLYALAGLDSLCHSRLDDIRDFSSLVRALVEARPDTVFHLAAQPLVRQSYREPLETLAVNVVGTANLLEAVRQVPDIRSVVVITSDKCYANAEWPWGYREIDPLGGNDLYSASKACAELVSHAYRRSFFRDRSGTLIATARAGNVIGGGDWATDRLIPDAVRAFQCGRVLHIRSPQAKRPWQHVLEPLSGYLMLAQELYHGNASQAESWNFGPYPDAVVTVQAVIEMVRARWGEDADYCLDTGNHPPESHILALDISKSTGRLGWRPVLSLLEVIDLTVDWYKAVQRGEPARLVMGRQIDHFVARMADRLGSDGTVPLTAK